MTIIAYKDGIVAYDSYLTRGNIVTDFGFNKHFKRSGYHIFLCGSVSDYELLVDLILGGSLITGYTYNAEALYVKDRKLYHCSVDNSEGFWVRPSRLEVSTAIGSGSDLAYAAMDCGRSAKQAVAVAIKRSIYCGGKIGSFKV